MRRDILGDVKKEANENQNNNERNRWVGWDGKRGGYGGSKILGDK